MASTESRRQLTGVVVSAGKMINTVKVRIAKQEWNKRIKKYYSAPKTLMVSDPTNSTREGDVVLLEGGRRISRHVRHVVADVVAPMGPPMSQRPPIPTAVERLAAVEARRAAKDVRQAARGRYPAIQRIREREAKQEVLQQMQDMGISSGDSQVLTLDQVFQSMGRLRKNAGLQMRDFFITAKREMTGNEGKLEEQPRRLQLELDALQKELGNLTLQMAQAKEWDQEKLGRDRLKLLKKMRKVEESMTRYLEYIHHFKKNSREYATRAYGWFDLVRALRLEPEERMVAALDLWGDKILNARERKVPRKETLTPDPVAAVDEPAFELDSVVDEIEEAVQDLDVKPEELLADTAELEPSLLADDFGSSSFDETRPETPLQEIEIIEDAALQAQEQEAEALMTGEKELPPTGTDPNTGSPNLKAQENIRKTIKDVEKGLVNEAEAEDARANSSPEQVEQVKEEIKEQKQEGGSGLWGFWRKR